MTRLPSEAIPPFPKGYRPDAEHRWTERQIDDLLGFIIDRATGIRTELHQAWGRVVDWTPGISAGPGVAVSGGRTGDDGSVNGRTQAEAIRRADQALRPLTEQSSNAARDFHIIAVGAAQTARIIGQMTAAKHGLRVATPNDGDVLEPSPRSRVGECANPVCGHYCTGIDNDRRRFGGLPTDDSRTGGRCSRCWRYRRDHNGEERPHEICHQYPVPGCKLCKRSDLLAAGHAANDVIGLVDENTA